jgi:hypothetical protein
MLCRRSDVTAKELPARILLVPQWFNLSDPGVEEALYDSASIAVLMPVAPGQMAVSRITLQGTTVSIFYLSRLLFFAPRLAGFTVTSTVCLRPFLIA